MAGKFKVLAMDGGAIREIIPALVLVATEQETGHRISELFDMVAGTSTGGILALGTTKPGSDGRAERAAANLVELYEEDGHRYARTQSWTSAR